MGEKGTFHVCSARNLCREIGYGHPYQGRYKCFPVETEGYFCQVVRYVERNALRANLVERAEMWPLSRPADWGQMVNQPQTESELEALRRCVNRGRPYGDPNWGWNGHFDHAEGPRIKHKTITPTHVS